VLQEAHQWINETHSDAAGPTDILDIFWHLLQDTKHCKTTQTFRLIIVLTVIIQFVKLHTKLRAYPRCQSLTTTTLITASCLGKGPYFAHKIQELKVHVLNHHALLQSKPHTQHEHIYTA